MGSDKPKVKHVILPSTSHPSGLPYYQPLRVFMAEEGLAHPTFDCLINLDRMLDRSAKKGTGCVSTPYGNYMLGHNESLMLNDALSNVGHKVDTDTARYVDVTALYHVLRPKKVASMPHHFNRFVEICSTMICTPMKFPTRLHANAVIDDKANVDIADEDDIEVAPALGEMLSSTVIDAMNKAIKDNEDMEKKIQMLTSENHQLRKKCHAYHANTAIRMIGTHRKVTLADELIDKMVPDIDMYCYKLTFEKNRYIREYSFNGHYVTNAMYDAMLDDSMTDDDTCTLYVITPYKLDHMRSEPTVGKFVRVYPSVINDVVVPSGSKYRKDEVAYLIKLAPDCYISSVPIDKLT